MPDAGIEIGRTAFDEKDDRARQRARRAATGQGEQSCREREQHSAGDGFDFEMRRSKGLSRRRRNFLYIGNLSQQDRSPGARGGGHIARPAIPGLPGEQGEGRCFFRRDG